jgi:hypothetical protein
MVCTTGIHSLAAPLPPSAQRGLRSVLALTLGRVTPGLLDGSIREKPRKGSARSASLSSCDPFRVFSLAALPSHPPRGAALALPAHTAAVLAADGAISRCYTASFSDEGLCPTPNALRRPRSAAIIRRTTPRGTSIPSPAVPALPDRLGADFRGAVNSRFTAFREVRRGRDGT